MKIFNYEHNEDIISELKDYTKIYYEQLKEHSLINKITDRSGREDNFAENRYLYFDIETTGLSARNSTLYLIGALWIDKGIIHIRQWFNDNGYSEAELISSFNEFCADFTHLVHFNGATFDVPYIKEKSKKHSVTTNNIEKLIQLDIFKEIRSYKNLLGLDNVKQVTIEKYLGLQRKDTYSGGELINVYQRYVARPDNDKEHLLLLHNHDDLLGMPAVSNILRYKALFEHPELTVNNIHYNNDEHNLTIDITLFEYCSLPKRYIHTGKNGVYINAIDNSATLIIPVIQDTLKHYFKDYKNYYYLPKEDMAIHKSVASYVDPENREKATKSNCYISKNDSYIICPDNEFSDIFQKDNKDKICYRTLESLINDSITNQNEYVKKLIEKRFIV